MSAVITVYRCTECGKLMEEPQFVPVFHMEPNRDYPTEVMASACCRRGVFEEVNVYSGTFGVAGDPFIVFAYDVDEAEARLRAEHGREPLTVRLSRPAPSPALKEV
jgi:hypothetical protein